ncbi:TonB-dependent receptor [Iodidimonas gelatinilytica]|uniref:TonB-dependent receptor n=2 Tax=Iodidimonas gelatinilytica TaxID=1236966 RepID=A0A5A7MUH1_9PROT|nr:TonB-dependent receptor [Iodidimonas gelatinilytica]GEQ98535.1 TonB-dependent receptor [Iodidimonas gelatinilytica]
MPNKKKKDYAVLQTIMTGVSASAISLCLLGISAYAQTSASTEANTEPAEDTAIFGLEEITITAQRYARRVQDAPVSVTAMTADYMVKQRINTADDVIQFTPGATFVGFNKTQPEYSIRGISSRTEGSSLESAILTVIDDVPISKDILKNPAMFDMQRVEVLRGPQGTSFGRNASAGLVHLVTQRPTFDFSGRISAGAGSHERYETDGYINVPLSEKLAARVAYNFDTFDGYTESISTGKGLDGQQNFSIRGSLLFHPTDRLSLYFKAEYNKDDDEAPVRRSRNCEIPQVIAGSDVALRDQFAPPGHPAWATTFFDPCDPWKTEISQGDFFIDREMVNLTGEIAWEIAEGYNITSVTGYVDGDVDQLQDAHGTPENVLFQRGVQTADIFTEEIRIDNHSTDSRLRWLAGFMYLSDDHDWFSENQFFQNGGAGRPDTRDTKFTTTQTDSIGIFGELSYDLTSKLNVTVGARWARDEKDGTIVHTAFGFGGPIAQIQGCNFDPPFQFTCGNAANPVGFSTPVVVNDTWKDLMGKASLEYQFNDDHMLYALFSQGYKAGGFQVEPPSAEAAEISFDEETSNNYEIGWRGSFGNRARLSVTAFLLDYNDLQLLQFRNTEQGFFQIITNAGGARTIGLEVEGTFLITPNLRLEIGGALQDPQLTTDVDITGDGIPDPTDGFRLDNAPIWTTTIAAEYAFDLEDGSVLTLRGDYRGRGDAWDDIINRELTQVGSDKPMRLRPNANIFGSRLSWESADSRWIASLWVQNLFEEEEILNVGPPQPNTVDRPSMFGRPRTWGADISYHF